MLKQENLEKQGSRNTIEVNKHKIVECVLETDRKIGKWKIQHQLLTNTTHIS